MAQHHESVGLIRKVNPTYAIITRAVKPFVHFWHGTTCDFCAIIARMARNDIKLRLNQAFDLSGRSKSDLGRHLDIDRSAASRILSGQRQLHAEEAAKTAEFFGISLDWLLHGRGEMLAPTVSSEKNELRRLSLEDEDREEQEELSRAITGIGSDGGYKPSVEGAIPEIDVLAGAGAGVLGEVINLTVGGETISAHRVVEEWVLPDSYLAAELHISPWRSLIMPVVGDSMVPTFNPGDRVLIDLNQNEMTVDAVYVISDMESPPQIKRLQRVLFSNPHMVDVISDNQSHQTQRVELAQLKIIGRVAGRMSKQ